MSAVNCRTSCPPGYTLIAIVYIGGYISGAHYNPALTIGAFIRGLIRLKEALLYILAQVLGALCGAGVAQGIAGKAGHCVYSDAGKVRCAGSGGCRLRCVFVTFCV